MRKPGRPKKVNTTIIYVRLPATLDRKLRENAKRERRELSTMVTMILEKHFGMP